jgi:hypothetical protein
MPYSPCGLDLIIWGAVVDPLIWVILKGSNEYYVVSTLYALGGVLSYQRILLFEGIYSQIESIYPQFGNWLLSKYNELGNKLDTIVIKTPKLDDAVKFFAYDRMALRDALTETQEGILRVSSFLNFKPAALRPTGEGSHVTINKNSMAIFTPRKVS